MVNQINKNTTEKSGEAHPHNELAAAVGAETEVDNGTTSPGDYPTAEPGIHTNKD